MRQCCLCGGSVKLTGEHKIKASALRQEFGETELYVAQLDVENARPKLAQSTQSKHLKFNVPVCEECNTHRTQRADREFDNFHKLSSNLLVCGQEPADVFSDSKYEEGTPAFLNVFRYFAKLLCCHMAEVEAPRPIRLSRFAIGLSHHNPVWLAVHKDWTYSQMKDQISEHQYAAHGGLIVYGQKDTGSANAFHSTLTVGPIQYVFFMRLAGLELMELRALHPRFYQWCKEHVELAKSMPLSDEEMRKHGLSKLSDRGDR